MALNEATRNRMTAAIERARNALRDLETQGPTANGAAMKALVDELLEANEDVRVAHLDPEVLKQYVGHSRQLLDEIENDMNSHDAQPARPLTIDHALIRPRESTALEDFDDNNLKMARTIQGIGKSDPKKK